MTSLEFPHRYRPANSPCVVRVGDHWYDLSAWRHAHPGGAQIVDHFHNRDATEAFYALHSSEAIARLAAMKTVPNVPAPPRPPLSLAFEHFRHELEKEGWFRRNRVVEAAQMVLVLALCALGVSLRHSCPWAAVVLIGVAMQQGAWLSHDYAHMRGRECFYLTHLCAVVNGMSRGWWSNKHNTHHAFPNRKEIDSDIHNEPILHLWFPPADRDVWYRRYQHVYFPFAYAFLLVSWRLQCIEFVVSGRRWGERAIVALGYAWLATLPLMVSIGAVLLAGFLIAIVVTANHQTEDILERDDEYFFVRDQFRTTRGVVCRDVVTEYLFGGMQYQLEHHLFPTMPRYHYPALRPKVRQFAKEHDLQYHMSGVVEILRMNYAVMRRCAQQSK